MPPVLVSTMTYLPEISGESWNVACGVVAAAGGDDAVVLDGAEEPLVAPGAFKVGWSDR